MPASNATSRFSDRVENYVRYRPGYPAEALADLEERMRPDAPARRLRTSHRERASGRECCWRTAIRYSASNRMRKCAQAGERLLAEFPKFTSMAGTAEATTLPVASVDFVTAAQAAHWFDRERARREFARILKPGGWLVLLWNERCHELDAVPARLRAELLLTYGTDYEDVRHERTTDAVNEFFDPAPYRSVTFANRQEFDYAGLEGRLAVVVVCAGAGSIRSMRRCCAELRRHLSMSARFRRTRGVRLHDSGVLRTLASWLRVLAA